MFPLPRHACTGCDRIDYYSLRVALSTSAVSVDRPSTRCVQHSRFSILNPSSTITSVLRGMYASKSSPLTGTHTLSHSSTTYASNSDNLQVSSSISKCHDYRSSPGSSITCFPSLSPPKSSPNSYTEFNPWGLVKLALGLRPLFIIRYTTTPQICNLYYYADFAGELLPKILPIT